MLRSCGVALNKRVASRAHSAVKKTSHHTLHTKKLRTHKRATHQNPSHTCHMTTRLQVTQHPPTHDSRQPPLIRDREPSLIRADPRASVGSVAVVRGWRTPSSAQASRPRTRCVVLGRDARPTSSADLCRLAAGGGRTWPSHHPPPPTSWWARGCRPRLDPPCLLQVGGESGSMSARPTSPPPPAAATRRCPTRRRPRRPRPRHAHRAPTAGPCARSTPPQPTLRPQSRTRPPTCRPTLRTRASAP